MNWLFLRGRMERHSECLWRNLDECTDMWTHLFAGMIDEDNSGVILYGNGHRNVKYSGKFTAIETSNILVNYVKSGF